MSSSSAKSRNYLILILSSIFIATCFYPVSLLFPSIAILKTVPAIAISTIWLVLNIGFGAGIYKIFNKHNQTQPDWVTGLSLGLGTNGLLIYFMASLSFLNATSLSIILLINLIIGLSSLIQLAGQISEHFSTAGSMNYNITERVSIVALAAFAVFILVMSSVPPTLYDSMDNHLALVQQYWLTGKLTYLPEHLMSYYPRLHEFVLIVPYALYGAETANVFTALITLAAAFTAAQIARRSGGSYFVTAALTVAIPLVGYLAIDVKNDMTLALFELAFIYIILDHRKSVKEKIYLSAFVLAFACNTKYSAIAMLPGFLFAAVYYVKPQLTDTKVIKNIAKALVIFTLLLAPFYLLTFLKTGSPVYPALPSLFGKASQINYQVLNSEIQSISTLKEIPLFFYNLFFNPFKIDGDHTVTGFALLFLLPFMYFLKRSNKRTLFTLLIIWLWCLVPLFAITTKIRFFPLFFIIPVILAGISCNNLPNRTWKKLAAVALLAGFVHSAILQVELSQIFFANSFNLLAAKTDSNNYLDESLTYYKMIPDIENNSAEDEIVLIEGEHRFAYINREVRISSPYETSYLEKLYSSGLSIDEIILQLKKNNIGIVYITFLDHLGKQAVNYPASFIESLIKKSKIIKFQGNHLVLKINVP